MIPLIHKDKRPMLEWQDYQQRQPYREELIRWFSSGYNNLGIVCGAVSGGLVVIDFDDMDTYEWWIRPDMRRWTFPCVATGKGRHVYVRLSQQSVGNRHSRKLGIDLRGEGGYVVAPPSIHPSGSVYYWVVGDVGKIPVAATMEEIGLPLYLFDGVGGASRASKLGSTGMPMSIYSFVTRGTFPGNRDRKAYWSACECRDNGIPPEFAVQWVAAGLEKSKPDRDPWTWAEEKVRSAYSKGAQ